MVRMYVSQLLQDDLWFPLARQAASIHPESLQPQQPRWMVFVEGAYDIAERLGQEAGMPWALHGDVR